MISHEEALELLCAHVSALAVEEVPTAQCSGRGLAQDVVARLPSPPFDKAAMDGFAVRSVDVEGLPTELDIVGESFAGRWPEFQVGPRRCARITTGAPVPSGADMVVMVEHTRESPDGSVRVEKLSGKNICARGEDITQGQVVLRAGQELTPLRAGVAASAGYDRLQARRLPTCAVLCTGTEVVEPPQPVGKGQIYNSNGYILSALLAPMSSRCEYMGIVGDQPKTIEDAVRKGLDSDLLVVTGGVSMGQFDLVPDVLRESGVDTVFHKCAIKPGKPVLFGVRGKTCVFGLPGNPLSCFVVFHVLIRPALALMAGIDDLPPVHGTGIMKHGFHIKPDRKTYKPCRVESTDGRNEICLVDSRGAADIMSGSEANAMAIVPRGVAQIEAGQQIGFFQV